MLRYGAIRGNLFRLSRSASLPQINQRWLGTNALKSWHLPVVRASGPALSLTLPQKTADGVGSVRRYAQMKKKKKAPIHEDTKIENERLQKLGHEFNKAVENSLEKLDDIFLAAKRAKQYTMIQYLEDNKGHMEEMDKLINESYGTEEEHINGTYRAMMDYIETEHTFSEHETETGELITATDEGFRLVSNIFGLSMMDINMMLAGFGVVGDGDAARVLMSKYLTAEAITDTYTWSWYIQACCKFHKPDPLHKALTDVVKHRGYTTPATLYNLYEPLLEAKKMHFAEAVMHYALPHSLADDIDLMNTFLYGLSKYGDINRIRSLMHGMTAKYGMLPDLTSYQCLLLGYIKGKSIVKLPDVLEEVKKAVEPDAIAYNAALHAASCEETIDVAKSIAREMIEKGHAPTFEFYNHFIMKLALHRDMEGVEEFLPSFQQFRLEVHPLVLVKVLHMYEILANIDGARQTLQHMKRIAFKPDMEIILSLVRCYGNSREFEEAKKVFNVIKKDYNVTTDITTIDAMMDSFLRKGDETSAQQLLEYAKSIDLTPSLNTYNLLMHVLAWRKEFKLVDSLWKEMLQAGINPDDYSYRARIISRIVKHSPKGARDIFLEMLEKGVTPQLRTYQLVIMSHGLDEDFDGLDDFINELEKRDHPVDIGKVNALIKRSQDGALIDMRPFKTNKKKPPTKPKRFFN